MVRRASIVIAIVLLAAACSSEGTATTTTTTLPDVDQLLADTAVTMEGVDTLHYDMELTGAPITLLGVELRRARGQYASPESTKAVLEAAIGGLVIELGTIAIGGTSWVTNPLSGDWEEYTGSRAFNPSIMFDPELGWRPLLTTDLENASLTQPIAPDRFVVTGTTADRRVEILTAGLVDAQPVDLEIEIDRESGVVTRMAFDTLGESGATTWTLTLTEFGSEVSVSPPEAG